MKLAQAVFALLLLAVLMPCAIAQGLQRPLPNVVEHADPIYPPLARQAWISGDVLVRFATDGQSVTSAEAETGHPLLRSAAEQNVRTWKFASHEPGTFHVTFRYEVLSGESYVAFLPEPGIVLIETPPPVPSIYWGWADRGKWKANLKSDNGSSQAIGLQILNSGPEGHWLKGDLTDAKGQKVELGDGYFDEERKMFWFTVSLSQPNGGSRDTFFVGKISGDRITGTFVDEVGATGIWTAVLDK